MQVQEAGHTTVQVARLIPVPVGLALPVRVGIDMPDLAVPHTTALAALFIVGLVGLHLNRLGAQRIQGLAGRVTQGLAGRATRGRVERGEGVLRSADETRDAMRLVLCLLLTFAAAPAWAEWVEVSETDNSIYYIDPATIRKDGNLRRVWTIQDLKQRHKDGEMSRRGLYEYDCKEERFRILSISEHSDPMARGKTLFSDSEPGKWIHTPPETPSQTMLRIVCAK